MNDISDWSLGYQAGVISKLQETQELKAEVERLRQKIYSLANTDDDDYKGLGRAIDAIKELTKPV